MKHKASIFELRRVENNIELLSTCGELMDNLNIEFDTNIYDKMRNSISKALEQLRNDGRKIAIQLIKQN